MNQRALNKCTITFSYKFVLQTVNVFYVLGIFITNALFN